MENENINLNETPADAKPVLVAGLTESQIEHQIEMDEEEVWGDDDDDAEILGYECMGCGNLQDHETGFGCDKCMGHCLEPWHG